MSKLLVLTVFVGLMACSNKAVHEGTRFQLRNECLKEPPSRYQECLKRADQFYEEYQRQHEEVLEQ